MTFSFQVLPRTHAAETDDDIEIAAIPENAIVIRRIPAFVSHSRGPVDRLQFDNNNETNIAEGHEPTSVDRPCYRP
ncbi:hypothetical protein EVAR_100968_1 [Eumeta japonica]|uniref:Uncharacterized protein n=1 Tax=Eumeta variegata TaxID=151549 RepID=A0A4C2AE88_EUMVA|nr:hypothetical protein EVAR_100968_1 [Eumeta japonica]